MKSNRLIVAITVAVMLALVSGMVFASGAPEAASDEPVTVHVRAGWQESMLPFIAQQAEAFEADNPGISINLEFTPSGTNASEKLKAEFLSGLTPDVAQMWKTYFNEFAASGLLIELSDIYSENGWTAGDVMYYGSRNWASMLPEARNNAADVYGIADYIFPSVMFYNTNVFEEYGLEPPTDIDDLIAVSQVLRANDVSPLIYPGMNNNIADVFAKIQAQTAGLQVLLDINDGKAKFTDPPMMEAARIFERLAREGVLDPAFITYDNAPAASGFVAGEAAMYSMHLAMDRTLQDGKAANPGFEYGIMAPIAFVSDPKVEVSATFGGVWGIPAPSKHVEEAKRVLAFLLGEESAKLNAGQAGRVTQFVRANALIDYPPVKAVVDTVLPELTAESFYMIDMVPGAVLTNLRAGLQEIILGTSDAASVMAAAQEVMDQVIADR